MAAKDASLIVQAGRDAGLNLPVAAAIAEQFARAVDAG
jgi:3-hydroxyisobutyrate dehydrogenase-like beta-hydroxyacid dehydrogenase